MNDEEAIERMMLGLARVASEAEHAEFGPKAPSCKACRRTQTVINGTCIVCGWRVTPATTEEELWEDVLADVDDHNNPRYSADNRAAHRARVEALIAHREQQLYDALKLILRHATVAHKTGVSFNLEIIKVIDEVL